MGRNVQGATCSHEPHRNESGITRKTRKLETKRVTGASATLFGHLRVLVCNETRGQARAPTGCTCRLEAASRWTSRGARAPSGARQRAPHAAEVHVVRANLRREAGERLLLARAVVRLQLVHGAEVGVHGRVEVLLRVRMDERLEAVDGLRDPAEVEQADRLVVGGNRVGRTQPEHRRKLVVAGGVVAAGEGDEAAVGAHDRVVVGVLDGALVPIVHVLCGADVAHLQVDATEHAHHVLVFRVRLGERLEQVGGHAVLLLRHVQVGEAEACGRQVGRRAARVLAADDLGLVALRLAPLEQALHGPDGVPGVAEVVRHLGLHDPHREGHDGACKGRGGRVEGRGSLGRQSARIRGAACTSRAGMHLSCPGTASGSAQSGGAGCPSRRAA
mmetsp:Transcript_19012/g.63688  ORF Transcript_19012/g.63688 Transcript_19012/m.63688 type:complete len:388 (-) Transcript_19012:390-1553(-)